MNAFESKPEDSPIQERGDTYDSSALSQPSNQRISGIWSGGELLTRWSALPDRTRLYTIKAWIQRIHGLHERGFDIRGVSLAQSRFRFDGYPPEVELWPPGLERCPPTFHRLREALRRWAEETEAFLTDLEFLFAVRILAHAQGTGTEAALFLSREIRRQERWTHAIHARLRYKNYLNAGEKKGPHFGIWLPGGVDLANLENRLREAENDPATVWLRKGRDASVYLLPWKEQVVAVKKYLPGKALREARNLFRPSRARQAYAGGRCLQHLGLPTPQPLGFLEISRNGSIDRYSFAEFQAGTQTVRDWIKPRMYLETSARRQECAKALSTFMLQLYRFGIFHEDTKGGNILVRLNEDQHPIAFQWIDCEALRFGTPPARRHILRNLIQLNGSIGTRISREDRLYFLACFSKSFPWLAHPKIHQAIEKETRIRLLREVRREKRS